eukprot:386867_1
MSESWKDKHIDNWTCQEVQDWIFCLKLGSKNQKKVIASIKQNEIAGADFNSLQTKTELNDSFPDVNKMSVNKIWANLKKVRKNKPETTATLDVQKDKKIKIVQKEYIHSSEKHNKNDCVQIRCPTNHDENCCELTEFSIPKSYIELSNVFMDRLQQFGNPIEIKEVSAAAMKHVLIFLHDHKGIKPAPCRKPMIGIELEDNVVDHTNRWFLNGRNYSEQDCWILAEVANKLGIESLLNLLCCKLATNKKLSIQLIDGKPVNIPVFVTRSGGLRRMEPFTISVQYVANITMKQVFDKIMAKINCNGA